jgi:hypothetical protein
MMCASIVNGDAIDDQNVKEKGRFLSEADPECQARGAVELQVALVNVGLVALLAFVVEILVEHLVGK